MAKLSIQRLCKSFTKSERLRSTAFGHHEGGNVAIMFAISAVALVGSLAVALDLTRGINTQINLADATDAVALMIAKSDAKTDADRMRIAEQYLAQAYPGDSGARVKIVSIDKEGDEVSVVLANNIDTTFGKIFNRDNMDVDAKSTAIYSEKEMDIALVLDTTLSMGDPSSGGGTKLTSLQSAATDMVTTIEGYENAKVRMSVVPFSNYVNVGLSRRNAPWLRVDPDTETTSNECWTQRPLISRTNCRTVTVPCTQDGVRKTCKKQVCNEKRGPKEQVCGPITRKATWNGCVGSRSVPLDTDPKFGGNRIPGLVNARCGTELRELTTNLSSVKQTIGAMTASGNTYMPSGLIWGWRTLEPGQPLKSKKTKAERVLILMTDGTNSKSKAGEWHEGDSKFAADAKTRELCNGIKGDKITVYTIAYEVSDPATRTLLNSCASSGSNFFNARNADELNRAFREIGDSLNELRITA